MKIYFNGGLFGREALCYQGREIVKQLAKYHQISIDSQQVEGYWNKYYHNFNGREDVYIMNGHVPYLPELAKKHKKIVSITQFETDLPKDWVNALKIPEVKQIWATSEFAKQLIVDSGVKTPVKIIYLGIDKCFQKKSITIFPKDTSFKFLNISAPHCLGKKDRKGLDVLIRAFKLAFGDDPSVTLFLKINTIYADMYNRRLNRQFNLFEYIKSLIPYGYKPGNIAIMEGYMPPEGMNNLCNTVHCGVFPFRGEGFGLPIAEMGKIGKPVIFTNYSAPTEFGDLRLAIKVKEMAPLDYDIPPYGKKLFADPDVEHLKHLMLQVYKNYAEEKKIAEEYAQFAFSKFDWDKIGKNLNNLISNII